MVVGIGERRHRQQRLRRARPCRFDRGDARAVDTDRPRGRGRLIRRRQHMSAVELAHR
jgi:hypothetical protein